GVHYGWGAAYRMPAFARGLELWAGGVADADFMGKLIASSVNKPYSMDLAAGLNAAVWAGYTFPTRGRTVATLRYRVQVPVGGVMFVPEWGQAYYEMSLDLHLNRILHLSSLHNRVGLNQMLCVDLRLPRSSWRVGVEHEYLHYQANRMHFAREFVSVHVGWLSLLDIRRGTRR
ncbi:MAG: hypothetical protein IJ680_06905, partial [Paludibacteraceae bacterium]|nr:hypothetical protein [Paludibacteraceae bacterium]